MKYRKRVLAMNELELKAALDLLIVNQEFIKMDKELMQEELLQWLFSEGLTARHEFLFYKEENNSNEGEKENQTKIWLLSRRVKGCTCCCEGKNIKLILFLNTIKLI
ncbi:hypothetical protein Mgra_00001681 [Meloidogyne graminicola]|uniref:Uncharacterized protein n=1 Tax=Meloidogyne graminicola TaxID=189291 RepID=A0A8S9ZZZ1_9BILA|nr:hypothetical protein Mgra_00001681 [Meloidogyne graminicola]